MQTVIHLTARGVCLRELPDPDRPVLSGLLWGRHDEIGTPAYWVAQAWMWEVDEPHHFRLGASLEEEVLACLLGGYGIPAEVGLAAYARLRPYACPEESRALRDADFVGAELLRPLQVGSKSVRYRFPHQKAKRIAGAFAALPPELNELNDRALRERLLLLPGIGPKTASWIVRNLRGSDQVAILDVHLLRAGRMLGIFSPQLSVERHYSQLEEAFLAFAKATGSRASLLDSVIWMTMRRLPTPMLRAMLAAVECDGSKVSFAHAGE